MFVSGEPGVGKTRLITQVASELHADGALVLAGRCDEDVGVAYQPFVEGLAHFVEHRRADQLIEELGQFGGDLTRLLPELPSRNASRARTSESTELKPLLSRSSSEALLAELGLQALH